MRRRGGRLNRRVYPNFAEFAERSTWYRNTTGVSGFTPWAMPAMLTGRYPSAVKAPIYHEYPDNLFTLLGGSYDLKVHETISQLCPPTLCEQAVGGAERTGLRGCSGSPPRSTGTSSRPTKPPRKASRWTRSSASTSSG